MWCYFLRYNGGNQQYAYIQLLPLGFPSHLHSHPSI